MKLKKTICTLFVILMIVPSLAFTALAMSDGTGDDEDLSDTLIPIPIVTTPEPPPEPQPLTPRGNLTLVDDASVDSIEEKQFITVETKNGNYFYIIVDRAGDSDNVHFLNLVDELDLFALLEDDAEIPVTAPEPYIPPQQPSEPEEEKEQEPESGGSGNLVTIIIILALAGAGAGVYFKVIKPRQAANSSGTLTSLDEYDEDDEPDGFDSGSSLKTPDTGPEDESTETGEDGYEEYETDEEDI